MKIHASLLAVVFLAGCMSAGKSTVPESKLIGQFCHTSIDAALCIYFKADHTYTESFSDFASNVKVGENGEFLAHVEPRDSGSWRLESQRVLLFPAKGQKRTLGIEEVGESIRLHESNGKFSREYRR